MKITKDKDNLIVTIPLKQMDFDAISEPIGKVDNIVGVIAGDFEQGIYSLNALGYKDDIQLGGILVSTYFENDEFRKICKELAIDVWEYETCKYCHKTIWGGCSWGDKGARCYDCEHKGEI